MKTITNIIYIVFAIVAFVCFMLSPIAQAVSPSDGAYANGNTAEGTEAHSRMYG